MRSTWWVPQESELCKVTYASTMWLGETWDDAVADHTSGRQELGTVFVSIKNELDCAGLRGILLMSVDGRQGWLPVDMLGPL